MDKPPILILQGGYVGHGADGHQVQVFLQALGFFSQVEAQRLQQLERDADAGETAERIGGLLAMGIDESHGWRQLGRNGMVVNDDDVQTESPCMRYLFYRAGAAVHRDNQAGSCRVQGFQGRDVQPVAFAVTVRNVGMSIDAQACEPLHQQGGAGDAVRVEVAVDDHLLPPTEGPLQPLHRSFHVGKGERIVPPGAFSGEKGAGLAPVSDTTVIEKLCPQGREITQGFQSVPGRFR